MIINSAALRGIFTSFNSLFNESFTKTPVQYDRVAMTVPSSSRETTYGWLGQMPNMREWIGDRLVQNLMTHSYTIKNKDFELTVSVPANDIADDQLGIYRPIVSEMGFAAKTHPDELIFKLMGNGFTNKGYDDIPFFSDNHPFIKAEKQSNKGTKKLSSTSYAEARSQMMTIKGEHKKSLKIVPDLLVVSPQNEAKAREILFADLISGNTNVNKSTCELLVVPELADYATQWYLLCTKRYIRPLVFQEREKPVLVAKNKDTDDNVFFQNEYLYGVKARYNAGYGLWQLAYGSTGEVE